MLFHKSDGEFLCPNNRVPFLGCEIPTRSQSANIRQVLLQLILG